mgnify:CR=1 FL=1
MAAVSRDLDIFHFNKAVARIRELTNALDELAPTEPGAAWVAAEALSAVIRMIGPMMPHIAEEMWRRLGHDTLLADAPWPEADPTPEIFWSGSAFFSSTACLAARTTSNGPNSCKWPWPWPRPCRAKSCWWWRPARAKRVSRATAARRSPRCARR